MKVDDIAEAMLSSGEEMYFTLSDLNFTPNDLINWADAHKGDLEVDGKILNDNEFYLKAIYYWPDTTNANEVYADAVDFINDFVVCADEINLTPIDSGEPWQIVWW